MAWGVQAVYPCPRTLYRPHHLVVGSRESGWSIKSCPHKARLRNSSKGYPPTSSSLVHKGRPRLLLGVGIC